MRRIARGFTLIEVIIHVIVVSIAISGTLLFFQHVAAKSAEVLEQKKITEAAAMLLEEIMQMSYTTNAPSAGRSRSNPVNPYQEVFDYSNFGPANVTDLSGTPLPGLSGYKFSSQVTNPASAFSYAGAAIPATSIAIIKVTVTDPTGQKNWSMSAYRFMHSPGASQ